VNRIRDAVLAGVVVSLAACTGGDDSTLSTTSTTVGTTTTTAPTTTTTIASRADGALVIGSLLPNGDAAPELAASLAAGIALAIEDVSDSGGDVGLVEWQMPAADGTAAIEGLDALIDQRADVIIGAPRSEQTIAMLPRATEEGVVVISATNSDPTLEDADPDGVFFRTATSDALQGAALAEILVQSGNVASVLILHRDDDFGASIADRFVAGFEDAGAGAPSVAAYDPETPLETVEQALSDTEPSTVILVALDEAGPILEALTATAASIWLTEPTFGIAGDLVDDPTSLAGVQGLIHLPFPDMPQSFLDRLQDTPQQPTVLTYAAEAYDAVVIAALAAKTAGTDDPSALATAIPDVTRGGEVCTTYADCVALLDAGTDIDYDGIASTYELSDIGDPTVVTYEWSRYDDDGEIQPPMGSITTGQ
jgi:ABC-type branched-subunit amino acid transport system substrate-binding protein